MSFKIQRACAWSAPTIMLLFFIGLALAGWIPPKGPGLTAQETAKLYQQHTTGIRIGSFLVMIGGTLFGPLIAVIAVQMRRMEGRTSSLANLQMGMGFVGGTAFFCIPTFFWIAAAYEPFRNPEITRALHLAGWLPIMCAIPPAILQNISIATAVFTDEREEPIFPRWFAYMNIYTAVGYCAAAMVIFFHTGPFSFNGVFGFGVPCVSFSLWCVAALYVLLKAINRQEREEATADGSTGSQLRDRDVAVGV